MGKFSLAKEAIGEFLKGFFRGLAVNIEITRERLELEDQWKKLAKKETEFLEQNRDKKFVVSEKFYEAALEEIFETFRWGEERGLVTFVENKGDYLFFGEKFYTHSTLYRNRSIRVPHRMPPFDPIEIEMSYKQIIEIAKTEGKFPYFCHTHPFGARPSESDFEDEGARGPGPVCAPRILIALENPSKEFQRFTRELFELIPKWRKVIVSSPQDFPKEHQKLTQNGKILEQEPFLLPKDFQAQLKNFSPKIILFYRIIRPGLSFFGKWVDRLVPLEIKKEGDNEVYPV